MASAASVALSAAVASPLSPRVESMFESRGASFDASPPELELLPLPEPLLLPELPPVPELLPLLELPELLPRPPELLPLLELPELLPLDEAAPSPPSSPVTAESPEHAANAARRLVHAAALALRIKLFLRFLSTISTSRRLGFKRRVHESPQSNRSSAHCDRWSMRWLPDLPGKEQAASGHKR
jgi:hypothetical protein